jgi:MFS family permease
MGPTTKPNPTTLLAVVAMAGLSYVLLALVALHVLRPDLNPISSPISEYAIGPNGLLFTSALLTWGGASLVLAFGLHWGVAPSGQSPTGLVLLVVFGVGLIVAGIFPMDVPFPPEDFSPERFTAAGATHIISATIATVSIPLAALLLSKGFAADARWPDSTGVGDNVTN